jgi:hypothetical protein
MRTYASASSASRAGTGAARRSRACGRPASWSMPIGRAGGRSTRTSVRDSANPAPRSQGPRQDFVLARALSPFWEQARQPRRHLAGGDRALQRFIGGRRWDTRPWCRAVQRGQARYARCRRPASQVAVPAAQAAPRPGSRPGRCRPADPGVPSRPIPITATLRHLHQTKESFTRCRQSATPQAAAHRHARRLPAAICKIRRAKQRRASFSAPQRHYP